MLIHGVVCMHHSSDPRHNPCNQCQQLKSYHLAMQLYARWAVILEKEEDEKLLNVGRTP